MITIIIIQVIAWVFAIIGGYIAGHYRGRAIEANKYAAKLKEQTKKYDEILCMLETINAEHKAGICGEKASREEES